MQPPRLAPSGRRPVVAAVWLLVVTAVATSQMGPISLIRPASAQQANGYQCQSEGFHVNPNDCAKFVRCVDQFLNGRLTPFHFCCPAGEYPLGALSRPPAPDADPTMSDLLTSSDDYLDNNDDDQQAPSSMRPLASATGRTPLAGLLVASAEAAAQRVASSSRHALWAPTRCRASNSTSSTVATSSPCRASGSSRSRVCSPSHSTSSSGAPGRPNRLDIRHRQASSISSGPAGSRGQQSP